MTFKKLLFLCLLLSACSSFVEVPTLAPTAPPIETPTVTPLPTNTPRPTSTPRPKQTLPPLEMEGNGDAVWELETPGSIYIVTGFHLGESNFIVKVINATTGDLAGLPINCIGECEETDVLTLRPGKYLIDITADNLWFVYWEPQN